MTRILRLVNRFNIGGPTYNAAYLSKYLMPEFETRLFAGCIDKTEGSSTYMLDQMGIHYEIIPEMQRTIKISRDYKAYKRILKEIRSFKPDIVHTHASKAGALGRLAAIRAGVPVIVHTFHGNVLNNYFSKTKTRGFLEIERFLAKHSNAIISISECQKIELIHKFRLCSPEKIFTVPLGFDLERFNNNRELKRKDFRDKYELDKEVAIGIIGRLVPIKDHELFLRSVKYLKQNTDKPFKVFITGDGEDRSKLEKLANDLEIGRENIIFTGWIRQIDEMMPGLDIVALTSKNEGTPVSLIEAQAAGVAIVSTKVGGVEDAVIPGESALLCKHRDPEEFGSLLLKITEDDELRKKLSSQGTDYVIKRYDYSRLIEDMKNIYYKLLAEAGK